MTQRNDVLVHHLRSVAPDSRLQDGRVRIQFGVLEFIDENILSDKVPALNKVVVKGLDERSSHAHGDIYLGQNIREEVSHRARAFSELYDQQHESLGTYSERLRTFAFHWATLEKSMRRASL
jgi:hypothetical protein